MAKKRYRPEDIISKLREADIHISQGKTVVEAIRLPGVSDVTYYRWRKKYGGMTTSQAKRLKELFLFEWKHVDFKNRRLMLRQRKNEKGEWWENWISVDDRVLDPLREHQKITGFMQYVFLNMNGSDNPKYWELYM